MSLHLCIMRTRRTVPDLRLRAKLRPRLFPRLLVRGLNGGSDTLSSLSEHEATTPPHPPPPTPSLFPDDAAPRARRRQRSDSTGAVHNITTIAWKTPAGSAGGAGDGCGAPPLCLQGSGVLYSMSSPHHTKLCGATDRRLLWSGRDITLKEFGSGR